MRDLCRKFQISSLEHITALIALYRPGPMDLIPEFISRRQGQVKIEYAHPLLEPICRETYGIMVYQEQVMQAAQALAGYTLGGADLLRRAMGKKKPEEMAKQREIFVKGAAKVNNIPAPKANQIFDLLEKFAGYGFNKSHAAAYAIVAYQTAYLKANYPVEFFCAMMTNDMGDTEKLSQYIAEGRAMGIEVLAPDVNESQVHFAPSPRLLSSDPTPVAGQENGQPKQTGSGLAIRFGLAAIKGVGEVAVQAILKARQEGGRFASVAEMCERVDGRCLNRKILEALIKCGACDGFGKTRATLFSQIDRTLARAASVIIDRQRGQSSLFGSLEDRKAAEPESQANLPEWAEHEMLAHEKELLGFYVTGHPLTPYAAILEKYSLANTKTIPQLPNRTMTRLGGMIAAVQSGFSKKSGKPYSIVTLEDLVGIVQVLCINENYDNYRQLLVQGNAIFVIGEVNTGEERPKLFPQEILSLDEAPRRFTKQVHLRLNTAQLTPERLEELHALIEQHPGKCPLFLCFRSVTEVIFIETHEKFYVSPSRQLQEAVNDLFGEDTYYVKVDLQLPERTKRWERKPEYAGAEG
jgi:DNA polymerase-3 subunit alpha